MLDKNASTDKLKVQLMVQRGDAFFIDKLDLYSSFGQPARAEVLGKTLDELDVVD